MQNENPDMTKDFKIVLWNNTGFANSKKEIKDILKEIKRGCAYL
jgi:hypothetical protein